MLTGSPELPLLNAAATQLAEHYGLPNWATAGRTESKLLDIQAGYEYSFSVPWVALSGATYISAIGGFLESVCTLSFEKFVIDDEVVEMVKRIQRGIDTDDEHCALDLISSVGSGGNFLGEEHTVQHMRKDFFLPSVGEISNWDEWNKKERPTALERARAKAKDTIAAHSVPPLPDDVVRQIRDVFPDIVIDTASRHIE
jgi:trimethylamine--corrinoid protein Co-methyltransferase